MNLLSLAAQAVLVVNASFIGDGAPPAKVVVVLEGSDGFLSRREFAGSGFARIPVPVGGTLSLRCEAAGFWGESRVFLVAAGETQLTCRLWRQAELTGELRFHDRPVVVENLRYRLLPDREGHEALEAEGTCAVADGGRFWCHLPAGTRSLALKAPGYAGLYFWRLFLEPGGKKDVGVLKLVRGSSIAGWVLRGADRKPAQNAKVTLSPQGERQKDKVTAPEFAATADERGFFQFTALNPGMYVLAAEVQGLASPLVVVSTTEGMETVLREPLLVHEKKTVSVVVTPPLDVTNSPWRVELWDQDFRRGTFALVARQVAGVQGECRFSKLLPQEYVVRVLSADGQSFFHKTMDFSQGEVFFVNLEMTPVRGTVRLGDEPVEAHVYFGGKSGTEKIVAKSDKEGRFFCVLPRAGRWIVQVEAPAVHLSRFLEDVDIHCPGRRAECQVELTFPATALSGQVVTPEGQGVKALVNVSGRVEAISQLFTEDDGRFLVRGLAPGWLWVNAETPSASSKRHGLVLAEGTEQQITLIVEPLVTVAGRVLFGSAGVTKARLYFYRAPQPGAATEEANAETNLDGSFEVSLLPGQYAVVVEAPGFCRQLFPTLVGKENPSLKLYLRQDCGTLVLGLPGRQKGEEFIVGMEGFWEWLSAYEDWARRHGIQLEQSLRKVPGLASGTYHFCKVTEGAQGFVFRECRQGFLPPWGELRLTLGAPPDS